MSAPVFMSELQRLKGAPPSEMQSLGVCGSRRSADPALILDRKRWSR